MALHLNSVGIQSITTACVESFGVEKKLEESDVVLESDGAFKAAEAYDPIFEFQVKGKGDIPPAWDKLGLAPTDTIADVVGGVTLITQVEEEEGNEAHNGWGATGTNYPAAA